MKLYLDLCVYNRPFDNQEQERIALETSAFIYILERAEKGIHSLVISEALIYENNRNPDDDRRIRIASYFQLANELLTVDNSELEQVKFLKGLGFSDIDALHIAIAEKAKVDYFITCDDEIVKLYKRNQSAIKVKVEWLIDFIALEVK